MTNLNIEPNGFYFQIPEFDPSLSRTANITRQLGAKASRLVVEERTRTHHPDGRRENVSEHSHMVSQLAPDLLIEFYPHLDANLIARFGSIHDDVEAYVLDTPTDRIDARGRVAKVEREKSGLSQLLRDFSHLPDYSRRVKEYEEQKIAEARGVRVVDKLATLLIHIPNQGKILKEHWTRQEFMDATADMEQRLLAEYPDFEELILMRTELAHYIANQFLSDSVK